MRLRPLLSNRKATQEVSVRAMTSHGKSLRAVTSHSKCLRDVTLHGKSLSDRILNLVLVRTQPDSPRGRCSFATLAMTFTT